jgi:hypothetical protein
MAPTHQVQDGIAFLRCWVVGGAAAWSSTWIAVDDIGCGG